MFYWTDHLLTFDFYGLKRKGQSFQETWPQMFSKIITFKIQFQGSFWRYSFFCLLPWTNLVPRFTGQAGIFTVVWAWTPVTVIFYCLCSIKIFAFPAIFWDILIWIWAADDYIHSYLHKSVKFTISWSAPLVKEQGVNTLIRENLIGSPGYILSIGWYFANEPRMVIKKRKP